MIRIRLNRRTDISTSFLEEIELFKDILFCLYIYISLIVKKDAYEKRHIFTKFPSKTYSLF